MDKSASKTVHSSNEIPQLIQTAYSLMNSNPAECIRLSEKALKLSIRSSFAIGEAQALLHIGLGYYHQGELAKAYEHYKQAENIFDREKENHGLRSVYNNLGVVFQAWKDIDKALEYFQKNLALDDVLPNPQYKINILCNIGNVHLWSRDCNSARENCTEALELSRKTGFQYGEALALSILANVSIREKKFNEAMTLINDSLEIRRKINDITGIIHNYQSLADISLEQKDFLTAKCYYTEAMEKAKAVSNKHCISQLSYQLATVCKELGEEKNFKQHLDKCLSLALPEKYRDLAVHALSELARYYEGKRRYKKALETYWQYQDIKNYLIDDNKNNTIQQLRMQLAVETKEREMELIRKTNLALQEKNALINRQKNKLVKAEQVLKTWNQTLELRVQAEMEKRQQQERIIIQKSKLESLGRLAAGIAHEINQPLGMINISTQNLFYTLKFDEAEEDYLAEKANSIAENIQRIRRIIEHVRLFSRDQDADTRDKTDIGKVISNSLSLLQTRCREHNINIEVIPVAQPLFTLGNQFRLEQVMLNLLNNAIDAVDEKFDSFDDSKHIRIGYFAQNENIVIEIGDNGSGINPEDVDHIFEPFFTTKSESRGTGLGLSICYGIVHETGGNISCHSVQGKGTTMTVYLPSYCTEESE